MHSQRRLPHIWDTGQPISLLGAFSAVCLRTDFSREARLPSGQAFATLDRLLDEARTGPFYLRQPALADMVVDAIQYNSRILRHYDLHAFVVMPNHIHLLATPWVDLPKLMKSLKGITAKRANAILGLTGRPFWQEKRFDHLVRDPGEFQSIRRWSSASATRGSPTDQGVRPTVLALQVLLTPRFV